MSFAGWRVPSLALMAESRAGGAPAFADPSSFNVTPETTRIVAVASTIAETLGSGALVASAAAARKIIVTTANALAVKW
jgi:hypothetical protein